MVRKEFESIHEIEKCLQANKDLSGAVFQGLDLTGLESELKTAVLKDNILLGCKVDVRIFDAPIIFPPLPDLPFKPYRANLYSPGELLGHYEIGKPDSYNTTVDGRAYKHFVENGKAESTDVAVTLARRLHDHAITDALHEYLVGKKVVAIMGGHSMRRDDATYLEVARLARDLAIAGYLPTSGGGPGAMEATHLGAWFAERSDRELVDAITILSQAPLYQPMHDWLDTAFTVVDKFPLTSIENCQSLGIPTWLYGHEPPTCFATHIAKYFANSVREEGLLAIAKYGVIFSPGSAGTIQEVFQDATQNHYESFGTASPMIFLGQEFWEYTKPIYPLLKQLAADRPFGPLISITDSRQDVIHTIRQYDATLNQA